MLTSSIERWNCEGNKVRIDVCSTIPMFSANLNKKLADCAGHRCGCMSIKQMDGYSYLMHRLWVCLLVTEIVAIQLLLGPLEYGLPVRARSCWARRRRQIIEYMKINKKLGFATAPAKWWGLKPTMHVWDVESNCTGIFMCKMNPWKPNK